MSDRNAYLYVVLRHAKLAHIDPVLIAEVLSDLSFGTLAEAHVRDDERTVWGGAARVVDRCFSG